MRVLLGRTARRARWRWW